MPKNSRRRSIAVRAVDMLRKPDAILDVVQKTPGRRANAVIRGADMPWTERSAFHIDACPDGEGQPSRLYIEFDPANSMLPGKRLFFSLNGNPTWNEADAMARELNTKLSDFCVVHLAAGEVR